MATYQRRSVGNWILFGFSAQHAAIGYLLGLLSIATFFARRPRFEGAGILSVTLRDWFSKRNRPDPDGKPDKGLSPYTTTLLRTIFWHEDRPIPTTPAEELDTRHENHEDKHIHQFEDACVQGFWLGLGTASALWAFGWYAEPWQPALVWELIWLVMPAMLATNWVTGFLRYGPAARVRPNGKKRSWFARIYDTAYLDSEHERSARAQTEGFTPDGRSWQEREVERRHQARKADGSLA